MTRWIAALVLCAAASPLAAADLVTESCHLEDLPDKVECFTLARPENPAQPDGRQILLHAARIPALTPRPGAPLAILAGGPGQSAIEIAGLVGQAFRDILSERAILLLEQRGTGQSQGFECLVDNEDPYADLPADLDLAALAQRCLAAFDGDPRQYHTVNAIHDFAALVRALGYPQVHLYGGSYGSRAALVFMRLYPALVASATLDGMAPVQAVVGPFGRHGYRAFDLLLGECEADAGCQAAFPDLRARFWRLWAELEQPRSQSIRHPHSNAPQLMRLDRQKLFGLVINNLYAQSQRQLLPYALYQATEGDLTPLAGLIAAAGDASGIYNGLTTTIVCNEDIRRARPEQLADDTQSPFGDASLSLWQGLCAHWPRYDLPAEHFAPVASDIPVLALSGRLDPVTPPAWGEQTVATLPNASHLVAEQAAHIVGLRGCGPKLVQAFVADPGADLADAECLQQLPGVTFMRNQNAQ